MSSGGQRGIDVSGITAMRLQNASDYTLRTKSQLVFQTFASTTGANAYLNETPNSSGYYLQFLQGAKENCSNCVGLPYQQRLTMRFRT